MAEAVTPSEQFPISRAQGMGNCSFWWAGFLQATATSFMTVTLQIKRAAMVRVLLTDG